MKKVYRIIFFFIFISNVLFAQLPPDTFNDPPPDYIPPAAYINKYLIVLFVIGVMYVFFKLKNKMEKK